MRTKVALLMGAVLLLAAAALTVSKPRTLCDILAVEWENITGISCEVSRSGMRENGETYTEQYAWQSNSKNLNDMIEILNATQYRPNFRNVLPFPVKNVSAGTQYDGRTAHVLIVWGEKPTENASVSFFGGGPASVSMADERGFLIFHPTDTDVLQNLVEYVQTNGLAARSKHVENAPGT